MLDKEELGGTDDGAEFEIPEASVAYEHFGTKSIESENDGAVSEDKTEQIPEKPSGKKSKRKSRKQDASSESVTPHDNAPTANTGDAPTLESACGAKDENDSDSPAEASEGENGDGATAEASKGENADSVLTDIPEDGLIAEIKASEGEAADSDGNDITAASDNKKSTPDAERTAASEDKVKENFPDNAFGIDNNITSYIEVTDGLGNGDLDQRIIPEDIFPDNALLQTAPSNTDGDNEIDLLGDVVEAVEETEDELTADEAENVPNENSEAVEEAEDVIKPPVPEETYDPEKPRRIDAIFDFVELLIFTLVAVLVITSFFLKHAVVEGDSMYDTLTDGDVLVISDLFYTPERGDIVVLEDYTTSLKKPIVKRVIALGGDRVTVKADGIYVGNDILGEPLDEPYVFIDFDDYVYNTNAFRSELKNLKSFYQGEDYYSFTVPEGELFVLGDHRNDSTDSRAIGTVTVDAVLGKVLFRVMPFDKFGAIPEE